MPGATARRSTSSGLTLESIVDAAAELIEADGFEALTMRRLAERCGVGAMTLYGYVRTKEDLLGALADRAFGEVELSDGEGLTWQEQVAEVFRSVRRAFLEHPELARIVATQPLDDHRGVPGRGGRLRRVRARRPERRGGDRRASRRSRRSPPASRCARPPGARARQQVGDRLRWIRALPADEFTHVVRMAGLLAARDSEQHFEQGLAMVIRGIGD